MAYFAEIENGSVVRVLFIENEDLGSGEFPNSEQVGRTYLASMGLDGDYRQTSFNSSFRYNYAGIGFTFDASKGEHGAFIGPQPFPSWSLSDDMKWQPPIPYPLDGDYYEWDEDTQEWQAVTD